MRTIRSIPRATKGDWGIWFFKHQRFVLSLVPATQLQPFLLGHNRIPCRYVVTLMLNGDMRKHPLPPPHPATRSIISVTHGPICKTRGQQPFVSAWFVYIPVPFPLFGLPPIRLLTDSGCSMLGRSRERGSWWPRLNLTAQQIPVSTYSTITVITSEQICMRLLYRSSRATCKTMCIQRNVPTSLNTKEISLFSFHFGILVTATFALPSLYKQQKSKRTSENLRSINGTLPCRKNTFLLSSGGWWCMEACYTVLLPSSYQVSLVVFKQHSSTG